jgi:hypothetical protein
VWNEYVHEKLHELDKDLEKAKHARPHLPPELPERQHRRLAPLARATGRPLRRIGEALESWASVSEPRRTRSWRQGGTG